MWSKQIEMELYYLLFVYSLKANKSSKLWIFVEQMHIIFCSLRLVE